MVSPDCYTFIFKGNRKYKFNNNLTLPTENGVYNALRIKNGINEYLEVEFRNGKFLYFRYDNIDNEEDEEDEEDNEDQEDNENHEDQEDNENQEDREDNENHEEKTLNFDYACLEFFRNTCKDVLNLPNISEYYSSLEKKSFAGISEKFEKENKIFNKDGGVRGGDKEYTFTNDVVDKEEKKQITTVMKKDGLCIKGDTQSGKEKFTVCCGIKTMTEGRTPIFITRNITEDANKLERGINNYSKDFDNFMNANNIKDQKFKIKCLRVNDLDNTKIHKQALDSLNKIYPCMLVSLSNQSQLSYLLEIVNDKYAAFDLFIDECDYVDSQKDDKKVSQTFELLKKLKQLAYQTFSISATILDTVFTENIKSDNVFQLSKPDDYRGFADITIKLLSKNEGYAINKIVKDFKTVLDIDTNLGSFLNKFSNSKLEYSGMYDQHYPNICLLKNTRINETQDTIFNGVKDNYPDLAVILHNSHGVKIYYKDINKDINKCVIDGKIVKYNTFSKIDVTSALQYLKDNGGLEKFPRIIIIAGELAGRCISYVSRDYDWHLTDMYYVPSACSTIPDMIQSAGRLCGRNKGKSHLHLHMTRQNATALYNGFNFSNEVIDRAISAPLIENGVESSFRESILNTKMNTEKYPIGRRLSGYTKVNKSDFKLVKGDDDGLSLDTYKYKYIPIIIVDDDDDEDEEKDDISTEMINESIKEIGEAEYIRLTTKMFPKWSNGNTKISVFMQNLDPYKVYNKKEFRELSTNSGIQKIGQLKTIKTGAGTKGFGTIIKEYNNTYKLHSCLINKFKNNF